MARQLRLEFSGARSRVSTCDDKHHPIEPLQIVAVRFGISALRASKIQSAIESTSLTSQQRLAMTERTVRP